jgi:hypothetical protein
MPVKLRQLVMMATILMALSLRANGCVMRPASACEIAVVILATVATCLCSPTRGRTPQSPALTILVRAHR